MPRKAGVKLTENDLDGLSSGRLTLEEVARTHGCTKQNVSFLAKKARRAGSTTAASASGSVLGPTSSPSSAPAPSAPEEPELTADELASLTREHIASGFLQVVNRSNALLGQELGPSALKAVATALGLAADRLVSLGIMRTDVHEPSVMRIEVYSSAELEEIRHKADTPENDEEADEDAGDEDS